jgi:hypothetical protein
MNSFQKITLTVATVILILTLIVLGVLIYNSRNSELFPPELSNCPDYFEMRQHQGLDACYNVHGLGSGSKDQCEWFMPSDNIKAKKDFIKKCGLTWDGLNEM